MYCQLSYKLKDSNPCVSVYIIFKIILKFETGFVQYFLVSSYMETWQILLFMFGAVLYCFQASVHSCGNSS